jgi:hypothetical protein
MNKDNTERQKGISFLKLIENKILIPKIQRDYAQGRLDRKTSEIRNNFLTSIFETLTLEKSDSLLLDFIYGSTNDNVFTPLDGQQRLTTLFLLHWYFIPESKKSLLFKEHGNSCYSLFSYETRISSTDFCNALVTQSSIELKKELEIYKNCLQKQIEKSEGELNSNEICDIEKKQSIIFHIIQLRNEIKLASLSLIIKNQSWFLWSWRKDPTVKAMLVMLDEIDKRTMYIDETIQNGIWHQLENGKIIFHKLPLEQFALTDELYVKMNARGKELSPFDIFKSSLEEQMQLNNVSEEIQNKWKTNIDSNWIDLFWNKLAKNKIGENTNSEEQKRTVDSVEKGFLTFFKRLIGLYFAENISNFKYDITDSNIQRLIPFDDYNANNLRRKLLDQAIQKDVTYLFPLFYKTAFFNEQFFSFVIDVFENLIYSDSATVKHDVSNLITFVRFSKERTSLFESFIGESINYETYLLFYSLINFCRVNKTSLIINDNDLKNELNFWIRIIRNLSTLSNTYIDDVEDFQVTLIAYKSWSEEVYGNAGNRSIINYFANHPITNKPKGQIIKDQFEEEITKATLIEDVDNGKQWQSEISEIEEHEYFLGQIRFLLNWSKNDVKYDLMDFIKYKDVVKQIFDSNGLKSELIHSESHFFRNCLMANCENYLLLKNEDCLVENNKERDRSWKSYFRNTAKSQNVKGVFDKYNGNKSNSFEEFCKTEITQAINTITDWRRCFLIKPEIYNKCDQNQIDYWDKSKMEICLLETSKKWTGNNRHSELNTFYWKLLFDNQNNWIAKYFNSQTETPLTTTYEKENKTVNICFEKINESWKYHVKLNFDPKESDFLNSNNNWSKHFETDKFMDVETFLKEILI